MAKLVPWFTLMGGPLMCLGSSGEARRFRASSCRSPIIGIIEISRTAKLVTALLKPFRRPFDMPFPRVTEKGTVYLLYSYRARRSLLKYLQATVRAPVTGDEQ